MSLLREQNRKNREADLVSRDAGKQLMNDLSESFSLFKT